MRTSCSMQGMQTMFPDPICQEKLEDLYEVFCLKKKKIVVTNENNCFQHYVKQIKEIWS